jgi:hypothetical protein
MSLINSASQFGAFPIDTSTATLNNENPIEVSNIQSNDDTNNSSLTPIPTETTPISSPTFSSIGSDLFAQTRKAKLLNFVPSSKQVPINNQNSLEPNTHLSLSNFSSNKIAMRRCLGI